MFCYFIENAIQNNYKLTFPRKASSNVKVKFELFMERKTMKIPKQECAVEFRELAVQRIRGDIKFGALSKELGAHEQPLRN